MFTVLDDDRKRVVTEQRLGFVATVCPDGTPNLSPKGTTAAGDDDHIVFADIRSPATISNLRRNPSTEINVVDPMVRSPARGFSRLRSRPERRPSAREMAALL